MSTVAPRTAPGVDHPSLVPALLLADSLSPDADHAGRRVRRSVRDWVVDVTAFVLSLAIGLLLVGEASVGPQPPSEAVQFADLVLGTAGCIALWGRRRWPVGLALGLAVIGTFSDMGSIAILIALFTVAVHRPWRTVLVVTAVNLASFLVYAFVRPDPELPWPVFLALGMALTAAVVAWGMFVRARRQLIVSLRDRADRAEQQQRLRVEQARQLERTRIAREMHDVLAHRLSLLSMHAGALEFRPDAPPAEVGRAAGVVRATARQALEDLREVIGVLRDSGETADPDRPQPTLADVPALVEESRQAGLRVSVDCAVPDLASAPSVPGRTAYRIVQEGLTNARKHAAGAVAHVRLTGGPGAGLAVELTNPAPVGERVPALLPGAGTGLVGLSERVGLAGGRLESGWTPAGEFRLHAWLPWPA
ncbi:sensor histidine kinase [Blastococcus sp. URHD0036]|uniref:sensor histidine kinase n=1 Tax=Blastococcus sp. URHD0036 TaxID=1380356 RepID=UPI000495EECD|nr:histidine kinase [Blastococcus sp. URHD0036]